MDASEIAALDQAFAIAVEDYIGTNWGTWTAGRKLGECLVENSASISAPAKEGVIAYGLEEVFYSISETASYSLSVVWDDCEQQSASESDGSDLADQSDDLAAVAESTTPELDQAFAAAVADFVTTSWAGWSDGVLLGECLAANASQIGGPAKQGVIDYGLNEVYDQISPTDSYSLGVVWDDCEEQVASGTGDSGLSDQSGETAAAPIGSV